MMWKLWHRLFGWDYIAWRNSADQGVARVYCDGDGAGWYYRYKTTNLVDRITDAEDVIWLTCPSSKYLKNAEKP